MDYIQNVVDHIQTDDRFQPKDISVVFTGIESKVVIFNTAVDIDYDKCCKDQKK